MKIDLHGVPAAEAYVPSPHYVKPGNYAEEIEDLMNDWLATKCPGWADVPIPDDMQERLRVARRLESQIAWLEANGRYGAYDHWLAFCTLRTHLPMHYADDAMGRLRALNRAWTEYDPPAPPEQDDE